MIKLLSLFSGIGAFEKALFKLNAPFELVNYCEIDPITSKIYSKIHNVDESKNLGDITKINVENIPSFDFMTYGFPCQSFSLAGKRLGFEDETRGLLFLEAMRLVERHKPKILIAENVKGLVNHDKGNTLKLCLEILNELGYDNYWKVLDSSKYGIPQLRHRIFIVSIRKDINSQTFEFPKEIELVKSWRDYEDFDLVRLNKAKANKTPSRDKMQKQCKNITNAKCCYTITTKQDRFPNAGIIDYDGYYRFLTLLEQWRLMGFEDVDFQKALEVSTSKIVLEKCAGNSIVVNVLEHLLKSLFKSYN